MFNRPSIFEASNQSVSPFIPKDCLPASSLAFTVKVVIQFDLVPWSVFLLPDNRTIGSFMFSDPVNFSEPHPPHSRDCRFLLETDHRESWNRGVDLDGVGGSRLVFALSSLPAMSLKSMLKVVSRSTSPAVTV